MYAEVLVVTLGVGENMIRVVERQTRSMRDALEAGMQMPVTIGVAVMTWMMRHAAWALTGFQVRSACFP